GRLLRALDGGQRGAVPRRDRDRGAGLVPAEPAGGRAMRRRAKIRSIVVGLISIVVSIIVFIVPFAFIFLTASKTPTEASLFGFSLPTEWVLWQNLVDVLTIRNGLVVRAFVNSTVITVVSVALMVV